MKIFYHSCPLCGSKNQRHIHSADARKHSLYSGFMEPILNWLQCKDCLHIFTESYWEGMVFSKSHDNQKFFANYEHQRYVASRIIEWTEKMPPAKWLDIGIGNGALALTAREFGFIVEGIEARKIDSDTYGVEIVDKMSGLYGVISMMDFLEHMPYPKVQLREARKHLMSDGILLLSMPNSDSPLWKSWGDDNPYWWEIEHYHNFSRTRLYDLLRECNFKPIKYRVSERYRAGMEVLAV